MEAADAAASSFALRLLTFSSGVPSKAGMPVPAAVFSHQIRNNI
jgi:hypothetical protein